MGENNENIVVLLDDEGKEYKLIDNEKGNTLHGGVEGLSTKSFDYEMRHFRTNSNPDVYSHKLRHITEFSISSNEFNQYLQVILFFKKTFAFYQMINC